MFIYFVLFIQSLMASGTHLVGKVVVGDIEPVTLTVLRSSTASIALFMLAKIRRTNFSFEKEDFVKLWFLGILAIPLNQFLFLTGIKHTTPANSALLYATTPALVMVISSLSGKERMTLVKTFGVAVAFCGILLVIFERGIDFHSDYTYGNLIICISVLAWTFYTILGKSLIVKYGAFKTSASSTILGTISYLPFGLYSASKLNYRTLTIGDWSGLLYLAIGTSIISYVLWYYALGKTDATKVAIFANLQPVIATVLAVVLLGQIITPTFILGGSIALAGVVLTQFG